MAEIHSSIALILAALEQMPEGPVASELSVTPGGEGLGWCEGTRGSIYCAAHLDRNGRLARVKVKSPSFSNWRVFPFTVHDSNMMDYAINEASFGLTMVLIIVIAVLQMPRRIPDTARHRSNRQHMATLTLFEITMQAACATLRFRATLSFKEP